MYEKHYIHSLEGDVLIRIIEDEKDYNPRHVDIEAELPSKGIFNGIWGDHILITIESSIGGRADISLPTNIFLDLIEDLKNNYENKIWPPTYNKEQVEIWRRLKKLFNLKEKKKEE